MTLNEWGDCLDVALFHLLAGRRAPRTLAYPIPNPDTANLKSWHRKVPNAIPRPHKIN